jgi:hypothetical protein
MLGVVDLGITDDGERASREQAAQIALALLADTAQPFLATARNTFGSATLVTRAVAGAGSTGVRWGRQSHGLQREFPDRTEQFGHCRKLYL